MPINEYVAFLKRANGGLGEHFVRTLFACGAAKVYAAARRVETRHYDNPRVVAALARETTLLVNNAGVNLLQPALASPMWMPHSSKWKSTIS
jgi:hypothetical protein